MECVGIGGEPNTTQKVSDHNNENNKCVTLKSHINSALLSLVGLRCHLYFNFVLLQTLRRSIPGGFKTKEIVESHPRVLSLILPRGIKNLIFGNVLIMNVSRWEALKTLINCLRNEKKGGRRDLCSPNTRNSIKTAIAKSVHCCRRREWIAWFSLSISIYKLTNKKFYFGNFSIKIQKQKRGNKTFWQANTMFIRSAKKVETAFETSLGEFDGGFLKFWNLRSFKEATTNYY